MACTIDCIYIDPLAGPIFGFSVGYIVKVISFNPCGMCFIALNILHYETVRHINGLDRMSDFV